MKEILKKLNAVVLSGYMTPENRSLQTCFAILFLVVCAAPSYAQSYNLGDVAPLKNYITGFLSVLAVFYTIKIGGKDMLAHYSAMSDGSDPTAKNKFFMSLMALVGIWAIPFIVNLVLSRAQSSGLTTYQNMVPN